MSIGNLKLVAFAAALGVGVSAAATTTTAAPVDVDIMFVIDQSGSMNNEFNDLSANISTFVNGLSGNADVSSLGVGLVTYEEARLGPAGTCSSDPEEACLKLRQAISTSSDLTGLQTALTTAANNVFGSIEDALSAVDSVLPGGSLFNVAAWRENTIKSIVLITDEDADDAGFFSYGGLTGYAALGAKLDDVNYLNNIITEDTLFSAYEPASRPIGSAGDFVSLFDLGAFNTDPAEFLRQFAAAKLSEITTGGTPTGGSGGNGDVAYIPLPAAGWLLLGGIGGLVALRRKKAA